MSHMLQYIPGVQRVYDEALGIVGCLLVYPLYKFKTQEMCIKAAEVDSQYLQYVPDCLNMEEMCKKVVEKIPSSLQYVPDHLQTQGMSDDAVRRRL